MAGFELKVPKGRELVGGDLVAQTLASFGVKVAFGLHGGHLDTFLMGCVSVGIDLVDTRHETTAVQAAEGYAKLSGNTGVCFITANSGFANGFPGLTTAFADRSPIFVVTSSAPLRDAETNCLQGFHDQVVLAKPVTKFCHRVTTVEEIPRLVSYAWRMARSGAPGPVLLDFPIDVLSTPPRINGISWGSVGSVYPTPPTPSSSAVHELLSIWKSAKRPVIITGTGATPTARIGGKQSTLLELAEISQTPVFHSLKMSSSIPHKHPLRGGPSTNLMILNHISQPQPDLVILLGTRPGAFLGGRSGALIPKAGCKTVQVDIDASEMGRFLPIDLGIVSDATEFVESMFGVMRTETDLCAERDVEWIKMTSTLKHLVHQRYGIDEKQGKPDADGDRMHPYHALNTLFETLKSYHPIILTDGGESNGWGQDVAESAEPLHSLCALGYLGFLGNGFGYSLGAALAHPDTLIINVQGDGSAGFHIAELDTFARHKLKVLTVVMNNYKWGMSIAGQDLIYGEEEPARPISSLSPACRFDIVAEGFGCSGIKCNKVDDIPGAVLQLVESMLAKGAAGLVNLIVDMEPVTEGTKAMVGKPAPGEGQDVIVVPYYDNIPRPYYRDS
ncbi:thiamine pyrophosphate enzyme, N-terminal TPP binding domain-containing protein [Ilyonectria robusta]|uniref:thiamine pyrophosphate enzyme, N-terminal TPP binding domain-containing protein n=1 Tax=Ilyonectria robusta TaxID=1079257 RepID=UPI001E8D3905|nr:thiamine pyrophosphate enzyme, N-terminal TPP binding domain-containing protein [Ilyonectria robusta]KAH8680253.1 thiamine pyrophosphate enzyme, N-terminal TPP binding domain-containing protein [Ilyonectria robusta]